MRILCIAVFMTSMAVSALARSSNLYHYEIAGYPASSEAQCLTMVSRVAGDFAIKFGVAVQQTHCVASDVAGFDGTITYISIDEVEVISTGLVWTPHSGYVTREECEQDLQLEVAAFTRNTGLDVAVSYCMAAPAFEGIQYFVRVDGFGEPLRVSQSVIHVISRPALTDYDVLTTRVLTAQRNDVDVSRSFVVPDLTGKTMNIYFYAPTLIEFYPEPLIEFSQSEDCLAVETTLFNLMLAGNEPPLIVYCGASSSHIVMESIKTTGLGAIKVERASHPPFNRQNDCTRQRASIENMHRISLSQDVIGSLCVTEMPGQTSVFIVRDLPDSVIEDGEEGGDGNVGSDLVEWVSDFIEGGSMDAEVLGLGGVDVLGGGEIVMSTANSSSEPSPLRRSELAELEAELEQALYEIIDSGEEFLDLWEPYERNYRRASASARPAIVADFLSRNPDRLDAIRIEYEGAQQRVRNVATRVRDIGGEGQ